MPESTKVVDSWAMVAWIQNEPAAPAFRSFLEEAYSGNITLLMSWLNVAETFLIRSPSLPIRIMLPDEDGIMMAARIKARHPVAFGDSFAIALAEVEQASITTGDNEIRQCAVVPVDWIGS